MDWIRRNWVDLLIALAFVAVISGIIATLLRGGSILPNRSQNNTTTDDITLVNDNASGSTVDVTNGIGLSTPSTSLNAGNAASGLNLTGSGRGANNSSANAVVGSGTTSSSSTGIAPIPLISSVSSTAQTTGAANTSAVTNDGGSTINPASIVVNPDPVVVTTPMVSIAGQSGATSITGTTTNSGGVGNSSTARTRVVNTSVGNTTTTATSNSALLASASAVPTTSIGTGVSVGAFSKVVNAERLANELRTQGFQAYSQASGNFNIVYLGPYATSAQANQVANQVKRAGLVSDTQLVSNVVAENRTALATSAANTSASSSIAPQQNTSTILSPIGNTGVANATNTSAVAGPPLASGGRYLQVGAYADAVGSLPQRRRLESLGYVVFDRVDNGYVKLIIGPYRSDELVNAQSRLRAQGVDSFPTR